MIVGPLWQTFVTSLSVYVRSSIECTEDPYGDRYDSDGAEKSLDAFVIQVIVLTFLDYYIICTHAYTHICRCSLS